MKRIYELPGIQDLSKEQELARILPEKGRYLVIGGPGTGKSVVALLRARRHSRKKEPYFLLVYNRLLHEASCLLGGNEIISHQWQHWFFNFFRSQLNKNVPRLPARNGTTWQDIDWEGVDEILTGTDVDIAPRDEFIIIDEGQDMPPEFYKSLVYLGFENFFVVADQNQQIVSGKNSSRRDLENCLNVDPDEVVELKKNYRNSRATAMLAQAFYTGDPSSPPPDLPKATTSQSKKPLVFPYKSGQFFRVLHRIVKLADREPASLTGVICPNNKVRSHYCEHLEKIVNGTPLDHPVSIRTYYSGCRNPAAFDKGGIMVINAQACKGLEFDHVFLADINEHIIFSNDPDGIKRLFYVMAARSRGNVILLQCAGRPCPVAGILPESSDILTQY